MMFVYGGNIWTSSATGFAEALLVKNGMFYAVGSKEYVESKIGPEEDVERINVDGSLVIPGISDSHLHLTAYCKQGIYLDLTNIKSIDEMLSKIEEYAKKEAQSTWLRVVGYNETLWDEPVFPTRAMLDTVCPEKPLLASRYCGHAHVANSLAIKMAGLWDSKDENIIRDAQGGLTGRITETGAAPILKRIAEECETSEKLRAAALEKCKGLAAMGITAVHACDAKLYGLGEDVAIFQDMHDKGELPIRVIAYHDTLPNLSFRSTFGNSFVSYAGLKIFIDGTIGGRTAALREPYSDESGSKGLLIFDDEELYELVKETQMRDIQAQIHMIGDAAIDQAIRVIEKVIKDLGKKPRYPIRFNHVIVCHPDQIERIKQFGAVLDIQPIQSFTDRFMAPARLGEGRMPHAYSFRRLYDSGLLITGSSDAPMEDANPWLGIWAAVCRADEQGRPLDGFKPDEVLTLGEALTIFTENPYKALGWNGYGTISEGTKADFAILDRYPFQANAQTLRNVKVKNTYLEGRRTF